MYTIGILRTDINGKIPYIGRSQKQQIKREKNWKCLNHFLGKPVFLAIENGFTYYTSLEKYAMVPTKFLQNAIINILAEMQFPLYSAKVISHSHTALAVTHLFT
jgi:hypothetical protein